MSTFPLPIILDSEEMGKFVYKATSLSFAQDEVGELISHTDTSFIALTNLTLKILLTSKGSVPNKPEEGTNLNKLLELGYSASTLQEDIALIMLDAENQIKRLQDNILSINPSTRLDSIKIIESSLINNSELRLVLVLENQAKQSVLIQLV